MASSTLIKVKIQRNVNAKPKSDDTTTTNGAAESNRETQASGAVEFKLEESMKKAVQILNKHLLNGRPLNVREDPDGEHSRRAAHSVCGPAPMGMGGPGPIGMPGPMRMGAPGPIGLGGSGPMGIGGPGAVGGNIPPSLLNNPNIPREVNHALQEGRLGSTVFVANLDYSVGWKKLKGVFGIAGAVVRADVLEDKDGKSRGIGKVTYEQPIEAVQAISMFNGQPLFDRPMMVKMDDKSMLKGDMFPADRPQQLPHIDRAMSAGFDRSELNLLSRGYGDPLDRGIGHVVYADIKTENGKSKGCGVVRFESPEVAEQACRMMNGAKLGGREIDVRMDRNA